MKAFKQQPHAYYNKKKVILAFWKYEMEKFPPVLIYRHAEWGHKKLSTLTVLSSVRKMPLPNIIAALDRDNAFFLFIVLQGKSDKLAMSLFFSIL